MLKVHRRSCSSSLSSTSDTEYTSHLLTRMSETLNILRLPNSKIPKPLQQSDYTPFKNQQTPIVIDNGSSTLRYGFALDPSDSSRKKAQREPFGGPNVVARFKDRKSNKPVLIFGDGVEFDSGARSQARTPWEGDVLLNFDALVSLCYLYLCLSAELRGSKLGKRARLCICAPRH